ncbi:hypothetical protein Mapa_016881 [Marchantia paleacea]|nr:hypothetical protein Mapa_016881 [Marchantia paleacea]
MGRKARGLKSGDLHSGMLSSTGFHPIWGDLRVLRCVSALHLLDSSMSKVSCICICNEFCCWLLLLPPLLPRLLLLPSISSRPKLCLGMPQLLAVGASYTATAAACCCACCISRAWGRLLLLLNVLWHLFSDLLSGSYSYDDPTFDDDLGDLKVCFLFDGRAVVACLGTGIR